MKRCLTLLLSLALSQNLLAARPGNASEGRPAEQDKPVREKLDKPNQQAQEEKLSRPAQQERLIQERPANPAQQKRLIQERPASPAQQSRQLPQRQTQSQPKRLIQERPASPAQQKRLVNSSAPATSVLHDNGSQRGNSGFSKNKTVLQKSKGSVNNARTVGESPAHERLKKLGIKEIPQRMTDRVHILDTDRKHSTISLPKNGPDGKRLSQKEISSKNWNDSVVRTHMNHITGDSARLSVLVNLNTAETKVNHYYWHSDPGGYNYCHYYDNWGYHWYGWYVGSSYFWTRYYSNSWWFFDVAFNRWCFWNGGGWWWQDPYNAGTLYLYDNGEYVPSTQPTAAAEPETPVETVDAGNPDVYTSNDNTRMVKILGNSRDAFLYDNSVPPKFTPIYLASKVDNVKFSDNSGGRAMRILVNLSSGKFELFDTKGQSLNFNEDQ